jgi:hypothetical protein
MATAPRTPREVRTDAPGGPWFWAGTAVGMGMLAFGVYGLLEHSAETVPWDFLMFFVGGVVLHDGVWAPAVGLASLALVRVVPRHVRPALQGTLIVTVAVLLVVTPALTGRGRNPNNPSILPGHYGTDTLKVLAVVWLAGALLAARALRREPTAIDPPRPEEFPQDRGGW